MPENNQSDQLLKFLGFTSSPTVHFWKELGKRKLEEWKLSTEPVPITGRYTFQQGSQASFIVDYESFENSNTNSLLLRRECCVKGKLINTNTVEEFKALDKAKLLENSGRELLDAINSGEAERDPSKLIPFLLITFGDIKNFSFRYWFSFPAIVSEEQILFKPSSSRSLSEEFDSNKLIEMQLRIELFRREHAPFCPAFFILLVNESSSFQILRLDEWPNIADKQSNNFFVCFIDPSIVSGIPGWPLRNLCILMKQRWGLNRVNVIGYKGPLHNIFIEDTETKSNTYPANGTIWEIDLGTQLLELNCEKLNIVGWESNQQGKMGSKQVSLKSVLDPASVSETSIDLNIKLMRWRLLPNLNTEMLKETKCLILGAGTLGCNIARCLLGWGIKYITFVDNGKVSFSNPVRQPLFEFRDTENGGEWKAKAAAESLKRIHPGVHSQYELLTIPMPGHPVTTEQEMEELKQTVETLEKLITEHDVIYLLTDTRESRWLPTLLAAVHDKFLLNIALGMDSFVVMRHGGGISPHQNVTQPGSTDRIRTRLGCYFCNDVVTPDNSTQNRTLDQQCTVTRPGLAPIASALGVELMVGVLHHEKKHHAPADLQVDISTQVGSELGIIPHHIRGFLTHFMNILPSGYDFRHCSACSERVIHHYIDQNWKMVLQACNESNFLDKLSGLSILRAAVENVDIDWDFDDDENI